MLSFRKMSPKFHKVLILGWFLLIIANDCVFVIILLCVCVWFCLWVPLCVCVYMPLSSFVYVCICEEMCVFLYMCVFGSICTLMCPYPLEHIIIAIQTMYTTPQSIIISLYHLSKYFFYIHFSTIYHPCIFNI
jgi:hypothetical protein